MKADTRLMKQLNISTLRRVLSGEGKATKPQLSRLTGLSVVTVNALITEMLEQGEVQELGMVPSGGGRPSMLRIPDYGDYLWASAGGQELYSYACCGSERAEAVGTSGIYGRNRCRKL